MELAETRRGNASLVRDGYCYRKRRQNKDSSVVWQCVKEKTHGCKGKLVVLNGELVSELAHVCGKPDDHMTEVRKAMTRARQRSQTEDTPVPQIFREELEPLRQRGYEVPSFENIKQTLYSRRKRGLNAVYPVGLLALEVAESDGQVNVARTDNVPSSESSAKKKRKEEKSSLGDFRTSTSTCPDQISDCGPSTSSRNIESTFVKEESFTEELIIEDCVNTELVDSNPSKLSKQLGAQPLPSEKSKYQFETIICGSGDVKVKQEIFEDESEMLHSSAGVDSTHSWLATESELIATDAAAAGASMNIELPLGPLGRASTDTLLDQGIGVKRSSSNDPTDLKEILVAVKSLTQESVGASETRLQDVYAQPVTSAPGHCTSNTPPDQPPHDISPYISTCDINDGIYVSLKTVPAIHRDATKCKIIELVKLLSTKNVEPWNVNFTF